MIIKMLNNINVSQILQVISRETSFSGASMLRGVFRVKVRNLGLKGFKEI